MARPLRKYAAAVIGLGLAARFLPGVKIFGLETLFLAGAVLWFMGLVVKPVLMVLTLPVNIFTLGIFTLVINAWLVGLTDRFVPGMAVPGFRNAFLAGLLIAAVDALLRSLGRD